MRGWLRDRGLTLVLLSMLALSLVGQIATGAAEYNAERQAHGHSTVPLAAYLQAGHAWEALFENWESVQMAGFVLLTTFLVQKGSPESRRPAVTELVDADPRDFADDPKAQWPVRRGGWVLRLYEHSLGLAGGLPPTAVVARIETGACPACRDRALRGACTNVRERPEAPLSKVE